MNRKLSGGQDEKPGRLMGCHHTQRNFGLALFVRVPSLDKPAISLRLPSHLPSEYTAIHIETSGRIQSECLSYRSPVLV